MDQVVELEWVDLSSVQSREAVAHVLEQREQLLFVIRADELSGLPPSGAFVLAAGLLGTHAPDGTAVAPRWSRSRLLGLDRKGLVGAADLTAP